MPNAYQRTSDRVGEQVAIYEATDGREGGTAIRPPPRRRVNRRSDAKVRMMGDVIPEMMSAVHLVGHGGLDRLQFRTDVPVPRPGVGEVLIHCRASSINNTDINTRIAWYSKSVTGASNASGSAAPESAGDTDGGWSGEPIRFPRIQGADCYGEIVGLGQDVKPDRLGERVLVRTMLRAPVDFRPYECWTFGSECDGGFAQFAVAPDPDVYQVDSDLTDAELGAIPCTYSTAEGMLVRAHVGPNDRILITGASGGVGSAAVQLAKLRGAEVIAVASAGKTEAVRELGADRVIRRGDDLSEVLGGESLSVIVDLVAGEDWKSFLTLLRRGGRYVSAGAIAGPIVEMNVRSLYLKDLTLYGCAFQEDIVFENIIRYLSERRFKPAIAATFSSRADRDGPTAVPRQAAGRKNRAIAIAVHRLARHPEIKWRVN